MDMDRILDIPEDCLDRTRFHYGWALDHKMYMTFAKVKGYEVVKASDPEGVKLGAGDPRIRQDGTVGIGDVVLVRCPIDQYREREIARKRRNAGSVNAVKQDFHAAGAQLGVRTFEDPTPGA